MTNTAIKTLAGITAAAALLTATVGTASAAPKNGRFASQHLALHAPIIERRIDNQHHRIRRGRRTGDLNRFERRQVRGNLQNIRWTKRRMSRDGVLSFRERSKLMRMLSRNSRTIRRLSNNSRFERRGRRFGKVNGIRLNLRF